MEFNFSKWQACGNDFVLVNAFNNEDISEIIANAEKICDRHFGVGAGLEDVNGCCLIVEKNKMED